MPNHLLSMSKIRQVLRCYASGSGTKNISYMLGMSRNTVKKYLQIYQTSGLNLEEVLSLEDSSLHALFQVKAKSIEEPSARYQALQLLLPEYAKRLKKKGVSRRQLFLEYRSSHPDGYAHSRFCAYLRAYFAQSHPIACLEHKAGDKMFIDYAGDKLSIIDTHTGEILPVEVFVAILPCSQLTFVQAVMSQRKEDLIHCCQSALLFYGGTPAAIVPDNLKAAVSRPSRYEAELNEDFAAFAEHYGCTVIPARVRKPRDKALVEGAIKLIYRSIYAKLEGREFYDLTSLNAAIHVALELHNNALLTERSYSRREQYEEIERSCMGPLNPIRFELKLRHTATVQKNGFIRLEKHYYSVPYKYIGKKVNVLYNTTSLDVYLKYERIATHTRSYKLYGYTAARIGKAKRRLCFKHILLKRKKANRVLTAKEVVRAVAPTAENNVVGKSKTVFITELPVLRSRQEIKPFKSEPLELIPQTDMEEDSPGGYDVDTAPVDEDELDGFGPDEDGESHAGDSSGVAFSLFRMAIHANK